MMTFEILTMISLLAIFIVMALMMKMWSIQREINRLLREAITETHKLVEDLIKNKK